MRLFDSLKQLLQTESNCSMMMTLMTRYSYRYGPDDEFQIVDSDLRSPFPSYGGESEDNAVSTSKYCVELDQL